MTILTKAVLVAMLTIGLSAVALHPKQREPFSLNSNDATEKHCLSLFAAASILLASPCFAMDDNTKMNQVRPVPVIVYPDPVAKETKEATNLQNLEDRRLSECQDHGDKWQECFFYGIGSTIDPSGTRFLRPKASAIRGVPTW
jgi:hypothetical protein